MSTMRIFSKKRFAIGPGAIRGTDKIELFVTNPGTFQDMPEKYKDDATFKLAVKAGEIEVIDRAPRATGASLEDKKDEVVETTTESDAVAECAPEPEKKPARKPRAKKQAE